MGYVDHNLITDESVTYRGRLHWILFVKPFFLSLIIFAAVALLIYALDVNGVISTGHAALAWVVGFVLSAIPIYSTFLTWKSAEFSVTNKRVVLKIGFIQSRTAEMFLNKIESVGVDQNVAGRMLGYGDIVIRGTGGSLEPFRRVSAPLEFRRQIQEQIGKSFGPPAGAIPTTNSGLGVQPEVGAFLLGGISLPPRCWQITAFRWFTDCDSIHATEILSAFHRKEFVVPTNLDLNTATEQELMMVQGLSKDYARKIVEYRNQHGQFKSWEDLKRIPGMPGNMLDTLKRHGSTVGGKVA